MNKIFANIEKSLNSSALLRHVNLWCSHQVSILPLVQNVFQNNVISGVYEGDKIHYSIALAEGSNAEEHFLHVKSDSQHVSSELRKFPHSISLPSEYALTRSIVLPLATKGKIDDVIQYEIDRFVPFKVDDIYFDYEIISETNDNIICNLTLVKREVVQQLVELYKLNNLDLNGITVSGGSITGYPNLLPEQFRCKKNKGLSILNFSLIIISFMLLVSFGEAILENKAIKLTKLKEQVAQQKKEAELVIDLKDRIKKVKATKAFPAKHNAKKISVGSTIALLSNILPSDTWLTKIEFRTGKISISGESKNATSLIELFELNPNFSDPKFSSSMIKNDLAGIEKFSLTMKLENNSEALDEE